MRNQGSAVLQHISVLTLLLAGLAGFARGSNAQNVKPVTSEPLEREIEEGSEKFAEPVTSGEEDAAVRNDIAPAAESGEAKPVASEELEREMEGGTEEAERSDEAVAREPLERDVEGEAEAEGARAADGGGVIKMLLGAFRREEPAEAVIENVPANLRPFMPALNQALTIEIHYLRKACNPDERQLKLIRAAGEKKVRELAATVARNRHQAFDDEEQGGRGLLQDALLAAAERVLPAEKRETYRKELKERQAARLRGACEIMTLNVNHTLSFPLEDYDTVVELLTENPEPKWTHSMRTLLYREYCPLPGIELIRPVLNDRQEKIWSGRPRRNSGIIFGWPANIGLEQWGLNVKLEELDDYSGGMDDD